VIRVSTDANYKPQSFQNPDGSFEGFDIDVGKEIAERMGVEAEFQHVLFDLVVAGGWNGRWDLSVGSVTVTKERESVLSFSEPYYYTPAQMAATTASGITTLEGFAGKTVCVGSSTTYQYWIEGTLELVGSPAPTPPPAGLKASPLETDQLCAQAIKSGRTEFDGFLTSTTTVDSAIADGSPLVKVGDPVFYEALAVATDLNGPPHAEFDAEIDRIIAEMHEDGTLTELSEKWFEGVDFTKTEG
jgi:polar amino acid transport system substrate-binding protein